jgi:hypothetical protein
LKLNAGPDQHLIAGLPVRHGRGERLPGRRVCRPRARA